MSQIVETKTVIIQQKSNAPLICGVIGFILGIPAILCGAVCSSICSGLASEVGSQSSTTGNLWLPFVVFFLSWIAGFVLSFFAKGKSSKRTGAFTILSGVIVMITGLLLGGFITIATGILYIISGGIAISNYSKA